MTLIYSTSATATGDGREGEARSADGLLDVKLAAPQALGGSGGAATNPEQLFAAGYAACFHSALRYIADSQGVAVTGSSVTADVGLTGTGEGFALTATLTVRLPGLAADTAKGLADAAHQTCPYSAAIRGNVEVAVRLA
ncbi:organic hydroperoxide resistance protein [Actinokineospora sp.]|uniref:organic hydroperoxide resistance protein n=1 Tax=Actinokineospora sp. TaxID=1872133 RepID=UPI004037F669